MNRVVWFIICTVVGLELIAWSLLVPIHLRSVDVRALELAGSGTPTLTEVGLSLVKLEKIGPARLLLKAAQQTAAPGQEKLARAVQQFEQAHPKLKVWGGAALYLERAFEKSPPTTNAQRQPIVDVLVSRSARDNLMAALEQSRRPGVHEIMQTRGLTNTVIFPPARSASGQPLDATIAITGLLFQQDHLTAPLRSAIEAAAVAAVGGKSSEPLELIYLDLLALGKRLDWNQLVSLVRYAGETNALHDVAELLRARPANLPLIYAAIQLQEGIRPVTKYMNYYPQAGLKDLGVAIRSGSGAVRDLLERQQPVHYPKFRDQMTSWRLMRWVYQPLERMATNQPLFAFFVKYGFCLVGALLLARALTYLSPALSEELVANRTLVSGPQLVIGLCLLFLVLFLSESLVARASPAAAMPLRIKLPGPSAALRATIPHQAKVMIDRISILSLLIFFVFQATIYVTCRVKLAEIRRQTLPSKLKLRLLENEEHLFDAGLYFGFVGTVLSLVLVSMGIVKPSLMAAYSSTSFGIIFVSILKIFHVRPYRRRLILDAEMAEREVQPA